MQRLAAAIEAATPPLNVRTPLKTCDHVAPAG
jgi:hypothetical protein